MISIHGGFRFFLPDSIAKRHNLPGELYLPNIVVDTGKEQFLRAVVRNEAMGLTGGPPTLFHIGLCNQTPVAADTIASVVTEPTVTFGYARKPVERDSTGWPTIDTVNGVKRAVSKVVTFTAAGGNFSAAFTRAFLCSVTSGTVGNLFAYSGALASPITLLNGESFAMQYELYSN